MKVLVVGASGATGRLAVQQLINRNIKAKIVIRDIEKIPEDLRNNNRIECVVGNLTEFDREKNLELVNDCDAVISCLGHNISFKGIFGKPRLLVMQSVINLCEAIMESKKQKVKFILMNTTGNRNRKINEKYSFGDRIVLAILSKILPPQKDNEKAAGYLSKIVGEENQLIEWVVVRPDTLINEEKESEYELFESPKQSPVFNPGKTSRINVSYFMTDLLIDEKLWQQWKYKMPVIYNLKSKIEKN
jgi:putative NADH-flavin reductase